MTATPDVTVTLGRACWHGVRFIGVNVTNGYLILQHGEDQRSRTEIKMEQGAVDEWLRRVHRGEPLTRRVRTMSMPDRLDEIKELIEAVDNRCMAADGPVTDTRAEMTADEMRRIYYLARGWEEDLR